MLEISISVDKALLLRRCSTVVSEGPPDHEKIYARERPNLNYDEYKLDLEGVDQTHVSIRPRGVFRENESDDIRVMVTNFTAPALATALRERETILQAAAELVVEGNLCDLREILTPFLAENIRKRRNKRHKLNIKGEFSRKDLVLIQRYLHRM